MVKGIDNELIYFIVSHHINHFLNVKKMAKHDYESHMILLVVYTHFLYQTITSGKLLSWTEAFDTSIAVNELDDADCTDAGLQAAPPTVTITIQGQ